MTEGDNDSTRPDSPHVDVGGDVHGDLTVAGRDVHDERIYVDDRDATYIYPSERKKRGGCVASLLAIGGVLATLVGLLTFFTVDFPQVAQNLGLLQPTSTPIPEPTVPVVEIAEPTPAPEPTHPPEPTPEPPHAPSLEDVVEGPIAFDRTRLLTIEPGQELPLDARDLYPEVEVPASPVVSCVDEGVLAYSWQVRSPYPNSGELLILTELRGARLTVGEGESGSGLAGPCTAFVFVNQSLDTYQVELRYAQNQGALSP